MLYLVILQKYFKKQWDSSDRLLTIDCWGGISCMAEYISQIKRNEADISMDCCLSMQRNEGYNT